MIVIAVLWLLAPAAASSAPAAPFQGRAGSLTAEQWREDIHYVADHLIRNHVNPFHSVSEGAFRDSTAALVERVESSSAAETIMGLSALVASVGDAHTYLTLPTDGPLAFRPWPVQFDWLEDGLVVRAATGDHTSLIGARVRTIGGIAGDSALVLASRYLYRENDWTSRIAAPRVLAYVDATAALGLSPADGPLEMDVILADGTSLRIAVRPAPGPIESWTHPHELGDQEPPRYLRHRDRVFWFEYVDELDAWYVQFNAARDAPDESIARFAGRIADSLQTRPAGRVVLDLRWNVGGNSAATVPLVRTLVGYRERAPGTEFFIITGRWTLSASIVMLGDLVRLLDPILVGEPTGARPNLFGENPFTARAPHSGLQFTWATQYFQPFGPGPQPEAVMPHVAALTRADDLMRGRDAALAAVAAYEPFDLGQSLRAAYAEGGVSRSAAVYEAFRQDPANQFLRPFDVVRRFGRDLAPDGADRTMAVYEWLMRDYPERSRTWELMGSVHQDLGRLTDARRHYEEALRRLPGDPTVSHPLRYALRNWLTDRLRELEGGG